MVSSFLSRAARSSKWTSWLTACGALALSFLFAEAVLGWLGVAPRSSNVPARYRIPHPVLGWALSPGVSYTNPLAEEPVRVTFNREGWRDLERVPEKAPNIFRIAVLGDSFMEGYSVNLAESFHRQLETELRELGHRVEVLNFGVGGYGTLQEYLVLRDVVGAYRPDLVLLGFCLANDVRNNSRALEALLGDAAAERFRPFLVPDAEEWRVTKIDIEAAWRAYSARLRHRDSLLDRFISLSHVGRLGERAFEQLKYRLSSSGAERKARDLAIYGASYCHPPDLYERAWQTTDRIMMRLRDATTALGARLVVFSEPAYREVDAGFSRHVRDAEGGADGVSEACPVDTIASKRASSMISGLGLTFVDLHPEFRSRGGLTLFRRSDRHWNPRGHALAAGIVAAELVARGYVVRSTSSTQLRSGS